MSEDSLRILLANPEPVYQSALPEAIDHVQFYMNWDIDITWQSLPEPMTVKETPFNLISLSVETGKHLSHAVHYARDYDLDWDLIVVPISGLIPMRVSDDYAEIIMVRTIDPDMNENLYFGESVPIPRSYGDTFIDITQRGRLERLIYEMGGCDCAYNPYQNIHPDSKEEVATKALQNFLYQLVD